MVLHNSILKFDFAYKMIILRQYSKKNYRKIPKSSKFCIKSQILNCLEFNNYWILLDKIKICCRISIPESLFPLLVFEFETSGADIVDIQRNINNVKHKLCIVLIKEQLLIKSFCYAYIYSYTVTAIFQN